MTCACSHHLSWPLWLLMFSLRGVAYRILLSYPRDPGSLLPLSCLHCWALGCLHLTLPAKEGTEISSLVPTWKEYFYYYHDCLEMKWFHLMHQCFTELESCVQHCITASAFVCAIPFCFRMKSKWEGGAELWGVEFPAWVNSAHRQVLSVWADTRRFGEALTFS